MRLLRPAETLVGGRFEAILRGLTTTRTYMRHLTGLIRKAEQERFEEKRALSAKTRVNNVSNGDKGRRDEVGGNYWRFRDGCGWGCCGGFRSRGGEDEGGEKVGGEQKGRSAFAHHHHHSNCTLSPSSSPVRLSQEIEKGEARRRLKRGIRQN